MTKVEYIKRWGITKYKKMLRDNNRRNKLDKEANSIRSKRYRDNMTPEQLEKNRTYQRERMAIKRAENRQAYNEYHNKYYKAHRDVIIARNAARKKEANDA